MLKSLLNNTDRFAVVDVETTGLYNSDRIVEVAVVTVDGHGEILDEWDTLVDPERDVGPTHIHGVTASMVSAAPRFEEIAAALADRLYGAVLVAHNLPFDSRMLANEFKSLGAQFVTGSGVCTLQLGGGKLHDVCRTHGIELSHAHRALGDARLMIEMAFGYWSRSAGAEAERWSSDASRKLERHGGQSTGRRCHPRRPRCKEVARSPPREPRPAHSRCGALLMSSRTMLQNESFIPGNSLSGYRQSKDCRALKHRRRVRSSSIQA